MYKIGIKNYQRQYYILNKEKLLEKQSKWYKNGGNEKRKKWRHRVGISKKYRSEYAGISYTEEYKRLHRKKYKYLFKNAGELSIKTIQLLYEDNIKRYGTLTCYLCEKPIVFREDHLEHKTPLSRHGTNEYNNLAISCARCNRKKHTKTEKEYRKGW